MSYQWLRLQKMIIKTPTNPVFDFLINTRPRPNKGDEIFYIAFMGRFLGISGLRLGDTGVEVLWGKM